MNDNIADKLINKISGGDTPKVVSQWGIDEYGFPFPKPVNSDAVAARIFARYENVFRIGNDIFVNRVRVSQNKTELMALCGRPRIVAWADEEDDELFWRQVKHIINGEWPLVWAKIRELAPEYNRDYIRIVGGLIWDMDDSDIIYKP